MLFLCLLNKCDIFCSAISPRSANEKIGDIFKTLGHCLKVILSFSLIHKINSIFLIFHKDDIFLVPKGKNMCCGLQSYFCVLMNMVS